eukprot:TRINITY_DN5978_c0_g3_i2.p1 TRINITY_DN5978_c0_g3~~TRINITY_DN5978_c0_g3_i2.p1  ORF type:complete len:397 (+),score=51.91 TRINITY_DN5978_c0_g3_i2:37-1227(+)
MGSSGINAEYMGCTMKAGFEVFSLLGVRPKLFAQAGILDSLTKLLRNPSDEHIKSEALKVLFVLCRELPEFARELSVRGIPILLREELLQHTQGVKMLSNLVVEVLKVICCILESDEEASSELNKDCIVNALLNCINFGKRTTKIEALRCLCGLSSRFGKHDTSAFTALINLLQKAMGEKDEEMTALCLTAVSYYAKFPKYLEFLEALEGFITSLLASIGITPKEMDNTFFAKYCQRSMLNLLKSLSKTKEQRARLITEGITFEIVPGLNSECADVRADCIDLLHLYISDTDTGELKMLLKRLLLMLSDSEAKVILRTLKCMQDMVKSSELVRVMIESDGVGKLMSLLTSVNDEVVMETAELLVVLMQSEEARGTFVKSDGIILVFSFIVLLLVLI